MKDSNKVYKKLGICPPENWERFFEYNRDSSQYYAVMTQKFGKVMADYYWNRTYNFEKERNNEYNLICKDINEKCDKFLKSRGIKVWGGY